MKVVHLFFVPFLAVACGGGGSSARTIDEGDDGTGGSSAPQHTAEIPSNLDGTQWRWLEAACTEGPLDLAARGYSSTLRIEAEEANVDLTYDSVWVNDGCQQTIVQHVMPPVSTGELRMEETARVAVPSDRSHRPGGRSPRLHQTWHVRPFCPMRASSWKKRRMRLFLCVR